MLAFGLGTLPMLLTIGVAAEWLKDFVRSPWVRRGAGLTVLLFGLFTIFAPAGHSQHAGNPAATGPHAMHEQHAR